MKEKGNYSMVFCGIIATEQIDLHPEENLNKTFSIGLTMDKHEPKFYVWCDYDRDWFWEFWYLSRTGYEKVKQCILDVSYECEDIDETLEILSEVFFEGFGEMLVDDDEEEICQCESVSCSKYLN